MLYAIENRKGFTSTGSGSTTSGARCAMYSATARGTVTTSSDSATTKHEVRKAPHHAPPQPEPIERGIDDASREASRGDERMIEGRVALGIEPAARGGMTLADEHPHLLIADVLLGEPRDRAEARPDREIDVARLDRALDVVAEERRHQVHLRSLHAQRASRGGRRRTSV